MLAFKAALYTLTVGGAFFFGFWELKLRRLLTDEALCQEKESVSDCSDALHGIRTEIGRERILKSLPLAALLKLRVVVSLKFLFVAILIIEVILPSQVGEVDVPQNKIDATPPRASGAGCPIFRAFFVRKVGEIKFLNPSLPIK